MTDATKLTTLEALTLASKESAAKKLFQDGVAAIGNIQGSIDTRKGTIDKLEQVIKDVATAVDSGSFSELQKVLSNYNALIGR